MGERLSHVMKQGAGAEEQSLQQVGPGVIPGVGESLRVEEVQEELPSQLPLNRNVSYEANLGDIGHLDKRASIRWANDAENKLSYTKMMHVYNQRHPSRVINGHRVPHKCCVARTGWHCICKSMRTSDIRDLGVGISVYFKFLKFMMLLFLWFTFLSLPAYFFYYTGNES